MVSANEASRNRPLFVTLRLTFLFGLFEAMVRVFTYFSLRNLVRRTLYDRSWLYFLMIRPSGHFMRPSERQTRIESLSVQYCTHIWTYLTQHDRPAV